MFPTSGNFENMIGVKKMQFLGLFLLQASVHYLKSQNRIRSSEKANKKRKKYTTSELRLQIYIFSYLSLQKVEAFGYNLLIQ